MDLKADLTEEKLRALVKQCNKCPKCNEICLEDFPVVQCNSDHRLCKACFLATLNDACFQCKGSKGNRNCRQKPKDCQENKNISHKINCPNASAGCKVVKAQDKMKFHVSECIFRPHDCLGKLTDSFACSWTGNFKAVPGHFAEKHPQNWNNMSYKHQSSICTNIYKNLQVFEAYKRHFVYLFKNNKESKKSYFYIAFLGSEEEAKKYCYEMEFFMADDPVSLLKFREICTSALVPAKEIFDKEKCVVLSDALKMRYTKNNKLFFKFWIKTTDVFSSKVSTPNSKLKDDE